MRKESAFEIKYENGSSQYLMAESIEDALKIADESLRSILPKNFNFDNLVQIASVRNIDLCRKMENKNTENHVKTETDLKDFEFLRLVK